MDTSRATSKDAAPKRWVWVAAAVATGSVAVAALFIVVESSSSSDEPGPSQPRAETSRVAGCESPATPALGSEGRETEPVARRSLLAEFRRRGYAAGPEPSSAEAALDEVEIDEVEAAESLRASVISAIRRLDLSPAERHETIIRRLEQSGYSSEPWTRPAPEVFSTWGASLPTDLAPRIGESRCFRAGCLQPVSYESADAYEAAAEVFRSMHDPELPHGGRILLPPRTNEHGGVETGWIMLPPHPKSS